MEEPADEGSSSHGNARRRLIAAGLLLLLVLFQVTTVRIGIDYGKQWDEGFLQRMLSRSVSELDAWPSKYFYGSLYAALGYLSFAPDWFEALPELTGLAAMAGQYEGRLDPPEEMREIQASLQERIFSNDFLVRTRTVFALFATLAIPFLFLAGARLGRTPWSGVSAAAVLALSWEFNAHSRHIAIDGVFVALVALFLYLLARHLRSPRDSGSADRWLYWAAAIAGFATAAKFHAALLLVPLIGVILARSDTSRLGRATRRIGLSFLITCSMLVLANPGLLLDTVQVSNDWSYTARDYWRDSRPANDPYKSLGTLSNLRQASAYVASVALSPRPVFGVLLFGLAVLGTIVSWRRNWKVTLAIGSFVPIYLLIMSQIGLLIVRNFLPILPFVALAVMAGIDALLLQRRRLAPLVLAFCALWVGLNGSHIVSTALSVPGPHDASTLVGEIQGYVGRSGRDVYLVSPRIEGLAKSQGSSFRSLGNVLFDLETRDHFDYLIYQPSEYPGQVPGELRVGYFERVFGPREVNYDYYPDWIGRGLESRAYLVDRAKAFRLLRASKQ